MNRQWPYSTLALWVLVACLSVAAMAADPEDGGCATAGPGEMAEAGLCPPIKVHVPYRGFPDNYGVNGMFQHHGVKWFAGSDDGHSYESPWYEHVVVVSGAHRASNLILQKGEDASGTIAWRLFRQTNNSDTGEAERKLVTQCDENKKFPWQCTVWNPAIQVHEMSWDAAHQHALEAVKVALRYAETVKTLAHDKDSKSTHQLKRAANNVKTAIKKVREIEQKAHYRGYVFGHSAAGKEHPLKGVDEIAEKAAARAANAGSGTTPHKKHDAKADKVWKGLAVERKLAKERKHKEEVKKDDEKVEKVGEKGGKKAFKRGKAQEQRESKATKESTKKEGGVKEKKKKAAEALREARKAKQNEKRKVVEEAMRAKAANATAQAAKAAKHAEQTKKAMASTAKKTVKKLERESQAAKQEAQGVHGTLSLGGLTRKQFENPVIRNAFIRSLAKSMGVPPSDIHIDGVEEADKDGKPTQKAKFVKEPQSLQKAKTAYDQATQKDEVARVKKDIKKDTHVEKPKKHVEKPKKHVEKPKKHVEKPKKHVEKDAHHAGSETTPHKAPVSTLLEEGPLKVHWSVAAPQHLLGARNVNVHFTVNGAHRSGADSIKDLNDSVKGGDFAKNFKAEAHAHGVELQPTAAMLRAAAKAAIAAGKAAKAQGEGEGSGVTPTKNLPVMPPHVEKSPSPPQKELPQNTRWDHKGKKGTFTRCASAVFGGHLELLCPLGTVITKVLYADLGHPQGPWCAWNQDPHCSFPNALPLVKAACEGEAACLIPTDLNLLAVKEPVSSEHARLDMNTPAYGDVTTQLTTWTKSAQKSDDDEVHTDDVVAEAVDDALRKVEGSASRSLLHTYTHRSTTPHRCWAATNKNGHHTARLVVRAECSGTMLRDGLHSAPSLALGHVTLAGIPQAMFEASLAYHEAFIKAAEASMCQCDVTDPKCVNDECAGEVVIKKITGDETSTDIEFKVRVPPTRLVADVERVMALELHAETKAYEHKEMHEKWRAKQAEEKSFMTAQEHEKMQKAMVESDEQKEKRIYAQQEQDEEKRSKEKAKKLDSAKWVEERRQKKFRENAEKAQDEAAAASERAMKMHYLHKEARAKRRAAKEILDKKSRAAAEVLEKSKQARQSYNKATNSESAAQANSNRASELFIKKHNAALQKQASVQQLKASGGKLDAATPVSAQALVTTKQKQAKKGKKKSQELELFETVEVEIDPNNAPQHPTFAQNFMAAAKMEGINSPPVGTSVEFWKAQQASAEADAAQLGVPAPPPSSGGPPDWFVIFMIFLLLFCCFFCILWCFCRQKDRVYNPYRHPHETEYIDPVVYQREQLIASGVVDNNGIPIQGGNRNDPIGLAPPGSVPSFGAQNTRALLANLGTRSVVTPTMVAGPSTDPRREHQKMIVRQEMEAAMRELNAVPWYKRAAVQSRINELLKWQEKLEDENRPLYASAHDPTAGFPRGDAMLQQRELSANTYVAGLERQRVLEEQQRRQGVQYAPYNPGRQM